MLLSSTCSSIKRQKEPIRPPQRGHAAINPMQMDKIATLTLLDLKCMVVELHIWKQKIQSEILVKVQWCKLQFTPESLGHTRGICTLKLLGILHYETKTSYGS